MALRLWLPLNGDIKNYGASTATVTNNGATVDSSGKIGNCYSFNGSSNYITSSYYIPEFSANTRYSISAWVYFTSNPNGQAPIIGTYDYHWSLYFQDIYTIAFVCWDAGGGHSNNLSGTLYAGSDLRNAWHHLVLTWDGSKIKFYLDGVKTSGELTLNPSGSTLTRSYPIRVGGYIYTWGTKYFGGKINDVRVYDHCLSLDEIKEISKGLVLYYPLNNKRIESTENLLSSVADTTCSTLTGYSSNQNVTLSLDTMSNGIPCIKCVSNQSSSTPGAKIGSALTLKQNTSYTFSATVESNCYALLYDISTTEPHSGYKVYTVPERVSLTFNTGSSTNHSFYILMSGMSSGQYFKMSQVQLEEKDHATPFTSSSRSSSVDDCSGYGNNAFYQGSSPTYVSDSPRNEIAFNTSLSSYIRSNSAHNIARMINRGNYSISLWVKYSDSYGGVGTVFCCGASNANNSYLLCHIGPSKCYIAFYNNDLITSQGISMNEWHHCVFTVGNGTRSIYVDGSLLQSGTYTTPVTINDSAENVYMGIGADPIRNSYWINGSVSDVKVYATTLSADDVAQEYHRYAAIYSNHSFNASDAHEYGNNLLEKTNFDLTRKAWGNNAYGYVQSNCNVTLTDDGVRVYRPANLTVSGNGNTMWGGLVLTPYGQNNKDVLFKGHTYIIKWHVKGKSSNSWDGQGWSNLVGWGSGGLVPNPSNVSCQCTPSNFNGEMECWYKWTINDDVYKVCTSSYSSFVQGETYLSYAGFKCNGFGYTDTGSMGTDIYISNIRMYDITDNNQKVNIKLSGVLNGNIVEGNFDKVFMMPDGEVYCTEYIEV